MANWLSRSSNTPAPRRRRGPGGEFEPVPTALQTGLPADYSVIDMSKPGFSFGHEVDIGAPAQGENGISARARGILQRILGRIGIHAQQLTNFRVDVGTLEETILPYNPNRAYLLVVNPGAAEVRIAYGRTADLQTGLPLAAGGGFHEPILGTVSSLHAVSAAAAQELIIIEGAYVWPGGK